MNQPAWRGTVRYKMSLAKHLSWQVGGAVERFFEPADRADLQDFMCSLESEEPVTWLGRGSNMLVRDGGLLGTVIHLGRAFRKLCQDSALTVYVEAGVGCARLAHFCAARGLSGSEFLAGIPGTVGGALAMNAGAFGGATWDLVVAAEMIDQQGAINWYPRDRFTASYRCLEGPTGQAFLGARLKLHSAQVAACRARIRHLLAQRGVHQPVKENSAGSVFRNPPGDYAARLIALCGLQGHRIGGAQVSEQHANFIVNTGRATAADIEALIQLIQQAVYRKRGLWLQPEVHILGRERNV